MAINGAVTVPESFYPGPTTHSLPGPDYNRSKQAKKSPMSITHDMSTEHNRVLIVEDDRLQAEILASVLRWAHFEVDVTRDGREAVWKAREGGCDIVLMDYHLPEIDGYAAARLIRDLMAPAARPILIGLTAHPEVLNARVSAGENAFDAIVGKSSDIFALLSVTARHLARLPERTARQKALFEIVLDSWAEYDAVHDRPSAEGDDVDPARILLIEDDELQRQILGSVLERHHFVVDVAVDGLEAVRKARKGGYDLLVVDYELPEIDGLAVAKMIYDILGEDIRPRLIGLTALAEVLKQREAPTYSFFDEILPKSSDYHGLISSMVRHMQKSPNPVTRKAAQMYIGEL
jgi:two-component system, sensor histidine kinase and response regulator